MNIVEKANSQDQQKFVVRFDNPAHRAAFKAMATANRRSMNAELLLLIEKALSEGGNQNLTDVGG